MSEHHLGEDLASFAAGGAELPESRRRELEEHVASCAACRRAIAESKLIFSALESPALEPSSNFNRALFARLDAIDAEAPWWSRLTAWFTPQRASLAMAAAVVVLLVVIGAQPVVQPEDTSPELAFDPESIELAENLELLQDFEVVDNLDVIDDLDLLAQVDEEEPG